MKVEELLEAAKTVHTETGTATLKPNGTMLLNNSGYRQLLTKAQVQAAWSGADKLPLSPAYAQEMRDDGETETEIAAAGPYWDGDYWDFGDESHIIPDQDEF